MLVPIYMIICFYCIALLYCDWCYECNELLVFLSTKNHRISNNYFNYIYFKIWGLL